MDWVTGAEGLCCLRWLFHIPDGPAEQGHCWLWKWHMGMGLMFLIKLELRRWPWSNSTAQLLTAPQPPLSSECYKSCWKQAVPVKPEAWWEVAWSCQNVNITAADRKTLSPNGTPLTWNKIGGQVSAPCFLWTYFWQQAVEVLDNNLRGLSINCKMVSGFFFQGDLYLSISIYVLEIRQHLVSGRNMPFHFHLVSFPPENQGYSLLQHPFVKCSCANTWFFTYFHTYQPAFSHRLLVQTLKFIPANCHTDKSVYNCINSAHFKHDWGGHCICKPLPVIHVVMSQVLRKESFY